jgi:two-component system sensor histidine kinase CiaH
MPDAALIDAPDAAEHAADEADARLLRSVRRRLVAWSGGVTLVVLLLIGVALYVAVERSLSLTAVADLQTRAEEVARQVAIRGRAGPPLGFLFGDPSMATLVVAPDGRTIVNLPPGVSLPGFPVAAGVSNAQASERVDLRTDVTRAGRPIRVLSLPVSTGSGTFVIQAVQSREEEQRTLDVTLRVLLVGGALAILVAFGVGNAYANRALVPIRTSLAGQRRALRRQREFAADASHELRTPLTVIRTSAEYLERHADERVGEVGTALEDIRSEVAQLTALVDDLLLLARSDSGAISLLREPVDLGDVTAEGASSLAATATARNVELIVDPVPATVIGDPARLRQLVVLLVDNAIKHGPAGGTVRVTVRSTAEATMLSVEDEGPGIPTEHLGRVFDRFWRSPGTRADGTGLGLAIAHWIATQHGGSIGAENRVEGGARFTVRLASAAPRGGRVAPDPSPSRPTPGS